MISYLKVWIYLKTDRRALTVLEFSVIVASIVATLAVGFNVLAEDLPNRFNATVNNF